VGIGDNIAFQLVGLVDSDLRRMAELVRHYADRHLGGIDASVIAVCERLAIVTAATVNLRDLADARPRHMAALATVPQDPLAACRHGRCAVKACRSTDSGHTFTQRRSIGLTATENKQTAASKRNMLTCLAGTRRRPHMPR
jgi:hypothetical protein